MARVLVTGASGLLGANAVLELAAEHQVIGVYHRHPIADSKVKCLQADLSAPGEAERLFSQEKPDWVLHCAAAADVDACERDPEMAFRHNRDMAGLVAEACAAIQARLVHISTDLVFDGVTGDYREEDAPNPVNTYGRSKLEGERAVLSGCPETCVVRTNIYGWNARDKLSLSEWFLKSIKTKGEAPGFVDMFSTPILVNDLLHIIERLFESHSRGIFHIGGAECTSKLEFGREIARIYGFDPQVVKPIHWREKKLYAKRADNLCLNSQKVVEQCGVSLPDVREGLARWNALGSSSFFQQLKMLANPAGNEVVDHV